jgi:hypothetical protein
LTHYTDSRNHCNDRHGLMAGLRNVITPDFSILLLESGILDSSSSYEDVRGETKRLDHRGERLPRVREPLEGEILSWNRLVM